MALAVRIYDIIIAAQENYEIDLSTLSDDERKLYEEIREETIRLKAEGKPLPMYELPIDAYDDVYEDVDIYSDHFDDDVMREVEARKNYVLTKAELKEKEFEDNIPAISRIVFMIGGYFEGYVTRTLFLNESQLRMEIKHSFEFDEIKHIYEPQLGYSKNEILEEIRAAHIGKWKKRYANNGILDGTQWELEIYFSNGHKSVKIYGSNDYPSGFDKVSKMMKSMSNSI